MHNIIALPHPYTNTNHVHNICRHNVCAYLQVPVVLFKKAGKTHECDRTFFNIQLDVDLEDKDYYDKYMSLPPNLSELNRRIWAIEKELEEKEKAFLKNKKDGSRVDTVVDTVVDTADGDNPFIELEKELFVLYQERGGNEHNYFSYCVMC